MALPHAQPLDVIDIGPLGPGLHDAVSTSLIKTERLQLLHRGDAGDGGGRDAG